MNYGKSESAQTMEGTNYGTSDIFGLSVGLSDYLCESQLVARLLLLFFFFLHIEPPLSL